MDHNKLRTVRLFALNILLICFLFVAFITVCILFGWAISVVSSYIGPDTMAIVVSGSVVILTVAGLAYLKTKIDLEKIKDREDRVLSILRRD